MPIEFACQCGKRYRVSDEHAGKRTQCKVCGAVVKIPGTRTADASHSSISGSNLRESSAAALSAAPAVQPAPRAPERWYVFSHDAQQYGPVSREELDQWAQDGRITNLCQVIQEGWPEWVPAVNYYPHLAAPAGMEAPADPFSGAGAAAATAKDWPRLLTATGQSKTLGNMAMRGEVKQMPGVAMLSSNVYRVGETRSLMERLKAGTVIGFIKTSEIRIDLLQLFHFRDASGEFAVIVPFDNGSVAPIEFVARMRGCLPSAIALLKQSGGRVALEAGAVLGGPLGKLLEHVGTKVESVWAGCDGGVPPAAQAAQQAPALREGIRWEGKIGGGPQKTIYRLSWAVQAIPLDAAEFLLVAQTVPRQKLIGLEFGAPWFCNYRRQFAQFVGTLQSNQPGEFRILDPGVWLPACSEILGWTR
jgi:hypothetical protein